MLYAVHKLYLLLPVLSHHMGHLVGARLVLFSSVVALSYSGKVTKAFPLAPSGYEMTTKIGVHLPHPASKYEGSNV